MTARARGRGRIGESRVPLLLLALAGLGIVASLWARTWILPVEVREPGGTPDDPQALLAVREQVWEETGAGTPLLEGHRYRVVIQDSSRDGASGIARIGGRVVFVRNAVPAEEWIVEITAVRRAVADAIPVRRIAGAARERRDGASAVRPGAEFTVRVEEEDRRRPRTDGVARINGLVVFIPGTRPGDTVRIRVLERRDRYARAVVVGAPEEEIP